MNRKLLHNLRVCCILFILLFVVCQGSAQTPSGSLLSRLVGKWVMTGNVRNKPVQYTADGVWGLQQQFVSFHMRDTASPPKYEAFLFIGLDSSKKQYVAHWLDVTGGAGARVVGMGPLSSDKIEIIYPYEEGRFRNLFKYDYIKEEWSFVIESEGKDGKWSNFAKYIVDKQ